jgi:type III restriction enzyme
MRACRFDFFIYDSAKLGQVRNFATSSNIQVMVVTVGAINKFGDENRGARQKKSDEAKPRREKSKNVMYRPSEKTGGEKPIDLIRATSPILIVDEPQRGRRPRWQGQEGHGAMNPLCTSALFGHAMRTSTTWSIASMRWMPTSASW